MSQNGTSDEQQTLISSLQLIDPMLQFLTKATNSSTVSLASLKGIIPKEKHFLLQHVKELDRLGVLMLEYPKEYDGDKLLHILNQSEDSTENELKRVMIGFPIPIHINGTNQNKVTGQLHGSTKTAGKRRLAYLKRILKNRTQKIDEIIYAEETSTTANSTKRGLDPSLLDGMVNSEKYQEYSVKNQHEIVSAADHENNHDHDANEALDQLEAFFSIKHESKIHNKETFCLPKQAAFAGSRNARSSTFSYLPVEICKLIPKSLQDMLSLQISQDDECVTDETIAGTAGKRKLYKHQADAIKAVFDGQHTLVCTGTGSGKSVCYLLPVLSDIINSSMENNDMFSIENGQTDSKGSTAILIFPTKALAQDQITKIKELIVKYPELSGHIRLGILDGDTPHSQRIDIAEKCNLVMTNPDTLHAAILPHWKTLYKKFLARLHFVVIDELHTYEGAFGSHVSLVISRLLRVARVSNLISTDISDRKLHFIGCSATIGHPEDHFRLLCPISKDDRVAVLSPEQDTSPCASKYYFVWNPPMVDQHGNAVGVLASISKRHESKTPKKKTAKRNRGQKDDEDFKERMRKLQNLSDGTTEEKEDNVLIKRRHPADETARLLAHSIQSGIRCIAFCKTRMLAEWVYEKCVAYLKVDDFDGYESKVEIYRGGYSASVRRNIEKRLFNNELLGVVGTSALELGIDIGGIDLTLHCGYPGSLASLLQQAGRSGRGANHSQPSFAIMVCFNSPCEQHIWKYPRRLMGKGLLSPPCIPLNHGLVEGHMLCASDEFPLCGNAPIEYSFLQKDEIDESVNITIPDCDLFGGLSLYSESIENLIDRGLIRKENIQDNTSRPTYSKHPCVDRPSLTVSLRSIEPITYTIVDLSHPAQGGKIDGIHDPNAIMDTIPYSRVFYHAFPGAIIMHRGKRYKIHTMNYPPCTGTSSQRINCSTLCAFAKPSNDRFTTRALSTTLITVVRQIQSVDLDRTNIQNDHSNHLRFEPELGFGSLAGSGVVSIKKTVHGYKKLSLVNRTEISRSELSLPPMEYDTNAIWIDCEAQTLNDVMPDFDAGVHALSHAILAVAPLFVSCTPSDLDCDHSRFGCTRVLLFDSRPGGTGTSSQLWSHFFRPNGVMKAAIDLLSECPLNCDGETYHGGCPGCLQAVPCVNFHEHMSRKAGLILARRMLGRLKMTQIFKSFESNVNEMTPRRNARRKALQNASDLAPAKKRGIVVGRPSWPGDIQQDTCFEPIDTLNTENQRISNKLGVKSSQGGFMK